ncbi:hypothetical protein AKN87_04575 [Thiopseudomonas alkaliphila]|uniref:DUF262 domain-containing protein n=1 Tax=Thiopseudomonas alkaliphila TaxID=1697053 RepID=UPI00069F4511|nr:DUF262 domain-containing protein [Thiopseudomonas alkaliphila]AKX44452.1 hypothetical protein AKN87_04575 [Thiopseudomonas alkaliphila]
MKIEAADKEIQDIFSLGYFKIPRFQRPYSWSAEEVESFWDDIILEKTENYFIGSMVVYQERKPYFGIVDGQQRLTTITLILSAIRNAFIKIGEENLAKGVHKYVEKANIDNEDEFILRSETSFPYLQSHIQSFDGYSVPGEAGVEEKKLEVAFELINGKLYSIIPEVYSDESKQISLLPDESSIVKELKGIRDKVLSLKLVFIQLDNEDDAYLIFETLNARGRDLATSDLVKNLFLKNIKSKSTSIDKSKELWNSLVKVFDDFGETSIIDSFLVHYWCSVVSYCTDKRLFSEIKTYVSDSSEIAEELLSDLANTAPYYAALMHPEESSWTREEVPVKLSLKALNLFKVKQQTAMTLALLRSYRSGYISLRNLTSALSKIEAFHYCFNAITSQRSSGTIASNYSRLAIELTRARTNDEVQVVLNDLKIFLCSRLPEMDEFVVKFSELEYTSTKTKNKAIVKYTLSKLFNSSCSGLPIDFESSTIEHILSESTLKVCGEAKVASIGNLILLDKVTNSEELSNLPPEKKFKILKDKNYPMRQIFLDCELWTDEEITRRTRLMAESIYCSLRKLII